MIRFDIKLLSSTITISLVQTVAPDLRQIESLMALDLILIPAVTELGSGALLQYMIYHIFLGFVLNYEYIKWQGWALTANSGTLLSALREALLTAFTATSIPYIPSIL